MLKVVLQTYWLQLFIWTVVIVPLWTVVGELSKVFSYIIFPPVAWTGRLWSERCNRIALLLQLIWTKSYTYLTLTWCHCTSFTIPGLPVHYQLWALQSKRAFSAYHLVESQGRVSIEMIFPCILDFVFSCKLVFALYSRRDGLWQCICSEMV